MENQKLIEKTYLESTKGIEEEKKFLSNFRLKFYIVGKMLGKIKNKNRNTLI